MSRPRRPLALFSALLLLSCQSAPVATASFAPAPQAVLWTGEAGTVSLKVELGSERRLLWAPTHLATEITAEVTGAGLTGWTKLEPADATTTGVFGSPGANGTRVATLSAKVPAGARRVFRVRIYDTTPEPDRLLDELWGVGDVPANTTIENTYPIAIKPLTTPVGRIFHQLIQINAPKALTLPIESVQHFVEQLLNTNWITGQPLRPLDPQVHQGVLDIEKATAAIIRGNGGIPFQIPAPLPEDLLVRDPQDPNRLSLASGMLRRGQVRLRAIDLHGQPLTRPYVFYLTDPSSPRQEAGASRPADATLMEVVPGSWLVEGLDLATGQTVTKPLTVPAGQLTEAYVVAPPTPRRVAGAFDMDRDAENSYNGEQTPAEMAYMSDTGALAIAHGALSFVDAGNRRIRRFPLADPMRLVTAIAGNGSDGHFGDGAPGTEARVAVDAAQAIAVDKYGATYFTQTNNVLRVVKPDGTIATFWSPTGSVYDDMQDLAYDAARHHLYVGCQRDKRVYRLDLNRFDGSAPASGYDAVSPDANGIALIPATYGGYRGPAALAAAGDYLFSVTKDWSEPARIHRHHLPSGANTTIVGGSASGPAGDDTPAPDLNEGGYASLAVDGRGNMFFRGDAGLYRVTNATSGTAESHDWRVKLVLPDAYLRHVALDPGSDRLYVVTRKAHRNASNQVRRVPVIQAIEP